MKKTLFLLAILMFFIPGKVHADQDFTVSMNNNYSISESGNTNVVQKISIKNLKDLIYTPTYSVNVGVTHIDNLQVKNSYKTLSSNIKTAQNGNKQITVTFDCQTTAQSSNTCLGKGREQIFTISYDTQDIAKKRGRSWEVNVPGISNPNNYASLTTSISVPKSFGPPTVMKPNYSGPVASTMTFSKSEIGKGGVFILYGSSQVYSYRLVYHLDNPNIFPIKTEIALPPPTNYQDVTLDSLVPAPTNVYRDGDGNWIAEYSLNGSEKMNVTAKGSIEVSVFPSMQELDDPNAYLKSLPFWDVSSSQVQTVANSLQTPADIYNYVVKHLTYNYQKTSSQNNRLGAKNILENPTNAVCLEFTDLFVALSRAKGIPARAIEGFAYTDNQSIRPSSLVKDILHAWPEYYDVQKKEWIMVDPTWGNTTGGMDYFNSLDNDHIAFSIQGMSSTYPIPAGGYKLNTQTQDVSISFSNSKSLLKKQTVVLATTLPGQVLSLFPFSGKVTIKNIGNTPIENKELQVQSEIPLTQSVYPVDYIPPFGSKTFDLQFSHPPILTNRAFKVTMQFDGVSESKIIQVRVLPLYSILLLGGGICAIIIVSIIALKSRHISF